MWHNKINNVIWTIFKLKTVYIFPFSFNPIKIEKSDKVSCDLMPIAFFAQFLFFYNQKFLNQLFYTVYLYTYSFFNISITLCP